MINFKVTVRADCSPLPNTYTTLKIPFKSSCSLLVSGRRMSWPLDRSLPSLWLHTSEKKPTFLSTDLASLLGLSSEHLDPLLLTDFDTTWDWALAIPACWGFSRKEAAAMKTRQEGFKEPLLMALRPWEEVWGTFLPAAETICFGDPPCFSPGRHWPPTRAFLVERKDASGRVEELSDPVSPWACTRRTSLFELEVLFGHFCQLVLMYVWCWGLFVLESVYLGLHIRHPLGIYDLSSGVWVCILFVWLVFLSFVKWKIQVQFIRKILAMKLWLQKKKKIFWTLGGH